MYAFRLSYLQLANLPTATTAIAMTVYYEYLTVSGLGVSAVLQIARYYLPLQDGPVYNKCVILCAILPFSVNFTGTVLLNRSRHLHVSRDVM